MKLSNVQIFWILTTHALGVTLMLTIRQTISISRQDAWISVLIGGAFSLLIVYVAVKLSQMFPKMTFVEYTQLLLGKKLGKLVLLLYFAQWYTVNGVILREFSELMKLTMPQTPTFVIIIGMLLIVVFATYHGIEIIGRCSEFIGPIIIISILVTFILNINNMDISKLSPVFEETGTAAILKGAIPTAGFVGQNFVVFMLIAFLSKPKDGLKAALWGTAIPSIVVALATLIVIATFSPFLPSHMWYPYFRLIRVISVLDFIQNVDVIFIVVWLTSVFMRLALIFFAATYGAAQFFNVKNWRRLIWINAPVVFLISLLPQSVVMSDILYPVYITQRIALPIVMFGIPLFLLILAKVKKRKGDQKISH
ncbi:GerAB/ArcD/ProY family transporter [Fictibacillus barbaricus]|uniref:Endospore germination permease n=1 Tax=Fictibacillus barbaricus TaxID=182136 RepID=A0ABS2Z9N6_9BACL|nr:endospore germination permease [Fictibacillus barbaricus]MBN3544146.1 endospore germination permease [Fictibacillus barbaricus]GGB69299.1 spore germination protein YndE [Fictibacillus barbaricus]